jgi:transposase
VCPCPYFRGSHYSIISAISITEVTAAFYTEGSVNGEIFLHFLENYLAPQLKAEQIIILDNVSFHKVKGVKEMIEGAGAHIIYLPPYSPDLSPIEHMWSKIKSTLRKVAARCEEKFKVAMQTAFLDVQESDLKGWFSNCGYQDQSLFKTL